MKYFPRFASLVSLFFVTASFAIGQLSANREGKPDPSFGLGGFASLGGSSNTPNAYSTRSPNGTVFHLFAGGNNDFLVAGKQLQTGERDPEFGEDGFKVLQFSETRLVSAIEVQPDGKLLGAGIIFGSSTGSEDIFIIRLTASGELDSTFGTGGEVRMNIAPQGPSVVSNDRANSILVQSDGKIIVAGISDQLTTSSSLTDSYVILARLNPDGTVDATFADNGISKRLLSIDNPSRSRSVFNARFQHDGKILGGVNADTQDPKSGTSQSNGFVFRYLPNGVLDNSFSNDGIVQVDSTQYSAAILPKEIANGKILMLAAQGLVQLTGDGSFDTSFGQGGRVPYGPGDQLWDFAVNSEGMIFLARSTARSLTPTGVRYMGCLQKFWPDGTPDVRFGQSGRIILDLSDRDVYLRRIWILPDGNLAITGAFSSMGFNREPFVARFFGRRKL